MKARTRSRTLHSVLAATLVWLSYVPDADALGPDGNTPWVQALVEEAENGDLDLEQDPTRLLRRLALSTSPSLRARVAAAAGALADPASAQALLRQLAHDPSARVRLAAARGLARLIDHADTRVRAAIESGWARARSEDQRVAFALALGHAAPDFLTDLTLSELANDPRPRVRRAALASARALSLRRPDPYLRVALTHLHDPDRRTRKLARATLRAAPDRPPVTALRPTPADQRASRRRLRRALRDRPTAPARASA